MKKLTFVVVLVSLLSTVSSMASAADGSVPDAVNSVLQGVSYLAAIALAGLLALVAKWVATKFKVSVPAAWMTSANVLIDKAIAYAEEWAKNRLGQLTTSSKISGDEKLAIAAEYLKTLVVDDKKLTAMTQPELSKLIQARLGEQRTQGLSSNLLATISPAEVKMLATNTDDGSLSLHMTDGTDHKITSAELEKIGFVRVQPKLPQAGFAKLGIMIAISVFTAIAFFIGCKTLSTDATKVGDALESCAKTEEAAVKKNTSVLDVALGVADVVQDLAGSNDLKATGTDLLTKLLTTYGEPIVACAFNKFKASHTPAAGSGAATSQPEPRVLAADKVITDRNWSNYK